MSTCNEDLPLPQRDRELSPSMQFFFRWTLYFFAASVCFHLFYFFVLHGHDRMVYPFSQNHQERFADFNVFTDKFQFFHTAEFYRAGLPIIYPAPTWAIFYFFFKYTTPHQVFMFVTCVVLSFLIPTALFGRALTKRGIPVGRAAMFVTVLCLISWPTDLIVDGANMEVAVWAALAVGMWAYATGRLWVAAVFFGFAASLKLFPFVFLALFLSRQRITKLLAGAATFLLTTLAALKFAGPSVTVAYRGYASAMDWAKSFYFIPWRVLEEGVDHSLFALYKVAYLIIMRHGGSDFPGSLKVYTLATALGGVALYFARIRKQPLLNQVLALSICAIYLTPFSGDGTLIHLYYPLAMIFLLSLQVYREGLEVPGLHFILCCMVFCLSMESFLAIQRPHYVVRFIGAAHAIALGMMLVAALRYPLGPPLSEGLGETVLSRPVTGWLRRTAVVTQTLG